MQHQDKNLITATKISGVFLLGLFSAIITCLYLSGKLSFDTFGFHFFTSTQWNPVTHKFSALSAIYGTVATSILAIVIALPISLAVAALTTNILPKKLSNAVSICLQVLAGIPSIIYGMWGLFVLIPIFASKIEPLLIATLGKLPIIGAFFSGIPMGIGIFTAGCVLAIMIIPLLTNMMVSLFSKVPPLLIDSGYASGATRFEVMKNIQLPFLKQGIIGSVILGLGRALGETMAVTFVIGNSHTISRSLLMPGNTIASTIANEFTEATGKLYSASLMELAFILMFITFGSIIVARILLKRYAN